MFQIDAMSRIPIYEQIIDQVEKFILTGTLSPGEQIPSVRSLSVELSINPVTILKAYSELDTRGLIHSVPGKGYFVCNNAKEMLAIGKMALLEDISEMVCQLALAGIPLDTVLEHVKVAYSSTVRQNLDERNSIK